MQTQTQGITLPEAPVEVRSGIQDAALSVIGAEQWLQSHKWREPIRLMTLAKGDQFLEGYRQFSARLSLEHQRIKRGAALFWLPVTAIGTLSGLAVGMWLSGVI